MTPLLILLTVLGGLGLLAQVTSIIQTQQLMNELQNLKDAVTMLQTTAALAIQALNRPVVPADEVQAQANAILNVVDSLKQNIPLLPS